MRWPIASGIVDTVLNAGAATAGSFHVAGVAINPSSNKLQLDTAAVGADVIRVNGMAMKNTGVVYVATTGGTRRMGGLLLTDAGVLVVAAGGTPVNHVGGIPVDSAGAVCVSTIT